MACALIAASVSALAAAPTPPAQAPAPDRQAAVVELTGVQRRATTDGVVVEFELSGPVSYRVGRLDRPLRLFLDLSPVVATEALRDAILTFDTGIVRQVRVGRPGPQTTRVVVESVDGVTCEPRTAAGPHRVVVTCREAAALPAPVIVAPPPQASPSRAESPVQPPPSIAPPAEPPGGTDARPVPPSANARGGYSISRQLGLRVGRIVIDPGHGGRDPGAMAAGTTEAAVTLDIALRLEKLLSRESGVEVILTRRTDEYVGLQERTAIANAQNADLFVSIHVNANRDRSVQGVETYQLNFASTPDAAAVAARENASSSLTMSHLNDLVKQIALGNKLQESNDLASKVQASLVRTLKSSNRSLRDLGVKQAPFVVLIGAAMPSVLVEVAFITNSTERKLIATGSYRQRIAESLMDGLRAYLGTLKRAEAVADRSGNRGTSPMR